jgi:hypothetical protein
MAKRPSGLDALSPAQIMRPLNVTDLLKSAVVTTLMNTKPRTPGTSLQDAGYQAVELKGWFLFTTLATRVLNVVI